MSEQLEHSACQSSFGVSSDSTGLPMTGLYFAFNPAIALDPKYWIEVEDLPKSAI